ncbi:MAG: hypothetical protein FWG45_04450 [Oscillospiraceae bacterium]|nr:hypothetical protein [Oscillospiraceae bacterium]
MYIKRIVVVSLCAGLAVVLVADTAGVFAAVSQTVTLCLNTIIPSLFAFLALSTFVISSGLVRGEAAIVLLSLVGGYPVGAKLLADRVDTDSAYAKRAERMLMYCYCGSPAFLLTLVGKLGLYVWLSNVAACLIFAVFTRLFGKHERVREPVKAVRVSGDVLISSVTGAGIALCRICLMMLAFAVVLRVLEFVGLMLILPDYAYAVAEITHVIHLNAHPAVLAALTSLGGLCVMLQTSAIVGGRFKRGLFLLARLPIAALSAGIAHLLTHSLAVQTLTTNRAVSISAGNNTAASLCLLVMTILLIAERRRSFE